MKKTIIAALALVAMAGCNKTLIEMPVVDDAGYGYLTLGITSNPDMVITKTGEGTDVTSTYFFTLLHSEEENGTYNTVLGYDGVQIGNDQGKIQDADANIAGTQIKLEAGWYKIKAMSAKSEAYTDNQKGEKYLFGESTPVQLTAGGAEDLNVECYVQNTAVSVKATEKFTSTFLNEKVTVSTTWGENNNTERSYVFINETEDTANPVTEDGNETAITWDSNNDMVFFPAYADTKATDDSDKCAKLTIKIEAYTAASQTSKLEYEISRESLRAKWTQITLDTGTNGTITVTIKAMNDIDTNNPQTETITLNPANSGEFE